MHYIEPILVNVYVIDCIFDQLYSLFIRHFLFSLTGHFKPFHLSDFFSIIQHVSLIFCRCTTPVVHMITSELICPLSQTVASAQLISSVRFRCI